MLVLLTFPEMNLNLFLRLVIYSLVFMVAGNNMHILLVEDDVLLAKGIITGLATFNYQVSHCQTLSQVRAALSYEQFDALILDLGLPDGFALPFINELRQAKHIIPVLVLTAWDMVDYKIEALNAGADDYVVKPFDLRELEVRLRVLVRKQQHRLVEQVSNGKLMLCLLTQQSYLANKPLTMTPREFRLLKEFMLNINRLRTREYLERLLFGWDGDSDSNVLEVHIHNLRKKIGTERIQTIRGTGYIMLAEPEESSSATV